MIKKEKNKTLKIKPEIENVKTQNFRRKNEALFIVLNYGVFGVLWILVSDKVLETLVINIEIYKHLQTYKGWIFVIITIVLIYFLVDRRVKIIQNEMNKNLESYDKLKIYEKKFRYMALYDSLTGLPNRTMFMNELTELLNKSSGENKFAIAYIDVDNFKYINDTLGHHEGNNFLIYLSDIFKQEIKSPNIAARLGGDEFGIIFYEIQSEELLKEKLNNIRKKISRTWTCNNHEFYITSSIGVAIYPDNALTVTDLIKNSDIAMYAAKEEGKNKVVLYNESIKENTIEFINMVNKLQKSIEKDEFTLYFQPQFELNSSRIVGMEALVRWIHPQDGFISSDVLISLAEKSGQIYNLEQLIFKQAFTQKKTFENVGLKEIELSINLSSKTLLSDTYFTKLESLLSDFNIDYTKIVFEITETAVLSDVNLVIERLNILKNKGIKIALDDFGTGYSSITYLKKLPIDIIKLDKSYISSVPLDSKNTAIVKNIIFLAHELGIVVVAEGIESNEQLKYLIKIKCESGQGYYLCEPMPIDQINDIIEMYDEIY